MSKDFPIEEKIYQQLLALQANDEFMSDVLAIRKKCYEPVEVFEIAEGEFETLLYYDTPEYKKEVTDLMKKFNLSHIFYFQLDIFIHGNSLVPMHKLRESFFKHLIPRLIPEIQEPEFVQSEDTGEYEAIYPDNWNAEQFVAIEIFPETTREDVINNWETIAKERDRLYGIKGKRMERFMRSEKLERDLYIYELKKQGLSAKDVVKNLTKDERFKNEIIGYEDVPKIIKRLKERANLNIPDKHP
ncbi:MAG: hypothetical protein PHW24_02690 [Candidatus Moranbacteria bacterium]|nr:hypothetical protein [Candidatus Moranbacteria bacterium]